MTINNRNCKVDSMTNRIIVSHKFLENSKKVYSEEFRTMIELQKMLPTFRIETMNRRLYRPKNPTYNQMRKFIEMQDDADGYVGETWEGLVGETTVLMEDHDSDDPPDTNDSFGDNDW